jgi:hypothetical protein
MTSRGRIKQLELARQNKNDEPAYVITNAMRFTFSILVSGERFSRVEELFLWNDIVPPAMSTFYTAQRELVRSIKARCERECEQWRMRMLAGCILAFDGSWSHRRGANECVVVFVDVQLKKIVDFEIVRKSHGAVVGDYQGSSNGMEVEALRRFLRDGRVVI